MKEPDWKTPAPHSNWMKKNASWVRPAIVLLTVLPILICGVGLWFTWDTLSAPYNAAAEQVRNHPLVITELGEPLVIGREILMGDYQNDNGNGRCVFEFSVDGSAAKGRAYAEVIGVDGVWTARELRVETDSGNILQLVKPETKNTVEVTESPISEPTETDEQAPEDSP